MGDRVTFFPLPIIGGPKLGIAVPTIIEEAKELGVVDHVFVDAETRDGGGVEIELVIPAEGVASRAESGLSGGNFEHFIFDGSDGGGVLGLRMLHRVGEAMKHVGESFDVHQAMLISDAEKSFGRVAVGFGS